MTIPELDFPALAAWANDHVPGSLFWSVSGAHLYGFPSADSDVDVRGCFLAPLRDVVGLHPPAETHDPKGVLQGVEVEAVAHEAGKYFRMMLKHNGYVLEQVFSPLVAAGAGFLAELRPLAAKCVTRNCYYHYRGFLHTQRKMLEKEAVPKAKTLLYAYRVVLTGIHLLRTGRVQSDLPKLNRDFALPYIAELIDRKRAAEFGGLPDLDSAFHAAELDRFERDLDAAYAASTLPEAGPTRELNAFLVNLRLGPG